MIMCLGQNLGNKNSVFILCHFQLLTLCFLSQSVALRLLIYFSMTITFEELLLIGLTISPKPQFILGDSQAAI